MARRRRRKRSRRKGKKHSKKKWSLTGGAKPYIPFSSTFRHMRKCAPSTFFEIKKVARQGIGIIRKAHRTPSIPSRIQAYRKKQKTPQRKQIKGQITQAPKKKYFRDSAGAYYFTPMGDKKYVL